MLLLRGEEGGCWCIATSFRVLKSCLWIVGVGWGLSDGNERADSRNLYIPLLGYVQEDLVQGSV
jgi:hypothetical protein